MVHFIQNWELYKLIPMKRNSHLPDEGFEPRPIVLATDAAGAPLTFMVSCISKKEQVKPNKSHRVLVRCTCDRLIPFGRMGQHYGKSLCKKGR